jgi:hypothetical protein
MKNLGIVSFLCVVYFVFTVILLFSRRRTGKLFIIFGVLTFALIILFGSMPSIPSSLHVVTNYLVLSLMILLLGMMIGIGSLFYIKLSRSTSIICSILGTVLFMVLFFNVKGLIIYMYIPVLLYSIVNRMDKYAASSINQ